jgi:hypothetical protein
MAQVQATFRESLKKANSKSQVSPREWHWEEDQPGWQIPQNLIGRKRSEPTATEERPTTLVHKTPRGMEKVNYVNESTGEAATFQRVELGGYRFFAWIPFERGQHLHVRTLEDVVCCLTPKRRAEREDKETACELEYMIAELSLEDQQTAKEVIEELALKSLKVPQGYEERWGPWQPPPRRRDDDDDAAGAGAAPVC